MGNVDCGAGDRRRMLASASPTSSRSIELHHTYDVLAEPPSSQDPLHIRHPSRAVRLTRLYWLANNPDERRAYLADPSPIARRPASPKRQDALAAMDQSKCDSASIRWPVPRPSPVERERKRTYSKTPSKK